MVNFTSFSEEDAMRKVPRRQLMELMDAYIDQPPGLAEIDFQGQVEFIEEFLRCGAPELANAFYASNACLRALSLFMKGKPFSRLDRRQRQDLIARLQGSRNPLLRGVSMILGLPVLMSYYRRPEVASPLGFDSRALKEEANLRVVSRERDLPPQGEG
jgi:hypothetical protein